MEDGKENKVSDASVLAAVLDGAEEAVIAYSADFSITLFNRHAEEMFGVAASSLVGRPFTLDVAKAAGFESLMPVMYSSLAPTLVRLSGDRANPQTVRIALDAPPREFFVATYAAGDGGFVKIVRETTREEALVKSKGDFVTVAAHQLRTPATALNWTLEGLEKDASLGEEARESVRVGHAAAQNMLGIITRLLDAAQVEDGKFGYAMRETDLVGFLDSLLASAVPVARQYGVAVYFDRGGISSLRVMADPAKLGLAFSNLIDNAVKYNAEGGTVTVGLSSEGGAAHVTVADTGMGIPEADMSKLFGKFFRAGNVAEKATEGTGLGLYLAKNIIEGHKGTIRAESAVGRGTTFHIMLPAAA